MGYKYQKGETPEHVNSEDSTGNETNHIQPIPKAAADNTRVDNTKAPKTGPKVFHSYMDRQDGTDVSWGQEEPSGASDYLDKRNPKAITLKSGRVVHDLGAPATLPRKKN